MINADAKLKEIFGKAAGLDVRDGRPDRQARQVSTAPRCAASRGRRRAGPFSFGASRRFAPARPRVMRAQRAARGDDLRVQQRSRSACPARRSSARSSSGFELVGARDAHAGIAVGARQRAEVGVAAARCRSRACGYSRSWCMRMVPNMPLLSSTMMLLPPCCDGRRQLLPVHQEVAVAGDREGDAAGRDVRGDAGRHAVAHRAAGRRQLRLVALGQAVVRKKRCTQLAKLPAPLVSTASSGRCFCSSADDGRHVDRRPAAAAARRLAR